jgi:hypothetical protein
MDVFSFSHFLCLVRESILNIEVLIRCNADWLAYAINCLVCVIYTLRCLGSIIMGIADIKTVFDATPEAQIVASHMETVNHCVLSRAKLKAFAEENGMTARLSIPADDPCWSSEHERSPITDIANMLNRITTATAKIGPDICLMVQDGIGHVGPEGRWKVALRFCENSALRPFQ